MASIGENYSPIKLWPTNIVEYSIEFDQHEEELLAQYNNDQFIEEQNAALDGPEKNFRLAWIGHNILNRVPEFQSISKTIIEMSFHYLRDVWNQDTPDDMRLTISDSWIVKVGGDSELGEEPHIFRNHNHAQALLTGIVYLDDSSHGTVIKNNEYAYPFYPFVWKPLVDDPWRSNKYISESVRGKVIIMPAKTTHELLQTSDETDFRSTLIFNIWPTGIVSETGGSELTSNDFNVSYTLKDLAK